MRTIAIMLSGLIGAAACLRATVVIAGPWPGATDLLVGTMSVGQTGQSDVQAKDKRRIADDLLRRARRAMAEGDLDAADSLISQAEALGVQYGPLHLLSDTPKQARRDLDRKRKAGDVFPLLPSKLFSPRSLSKKKTPQIDPFAARRDNPVPAGLTDKKSLAQSCVLKGREELLRKNLAGAAHWYRMAKQQQATFGPGEDSPARLAADIRRAGGRVDEPPTGADHLDPPDVVPPPVDSPNPVRPIPDRTASSRQSPFGRPVITSPPGDSPRQLPAALARSRPLRPETNRAKSGVLLREARRALAVCDVNRATTLVEQAQAEQVRYGPLDDSPAKVQAAIRNYTEVTARQEDTQAYRRAYARMLMEQSEALLRWGEFAEAERLANRASGQRATYGPFEVKPEDLLRRIEIAGRQSSGSTSESPLSVAAGRSSGPAPSLAARKRVEELVRRAREALDAGQMDRAEALAREAQQLRVPDSAYTPNEDRPGLVLLDIRSARRDNPSRVVHAGGQIAEPARNGLAGSHTASRAAYDPSNDSTRNMPAADPQRISAASGVGIAPRQLDFAQGVSPPARPTGPPVSPGMSLFRQGIEELKAHNAQRAYELFRRAADRMDELDPIAAQHVQGYLQNLSVPNKTNQNSVSAPSILDETADRQAPLAEQISSEVAHQSASAKAMRARDPKRALALLEETRKKVEAAGLAADARRQLLMRVDRALGETRQYIEQNRPRIELAERNQQTREEIEREQSLKLDKQQKLALLVDEFNKKMDEQLFAQAEVVAKRAAELDPRNPVVQQLLHESKLIRHIYNNQAMRDRKQESFLAQLESVDASGTGFDDRDPYRFSDAREWRELTARRSRWLRQRGRQRSESEIEIQRKLKTPVSFDFQNKPLSEALDYLAKVTDVNMFLDPQGLAEYGVDTNTPVTIGVRREIMLKSALNLILEPLHLSFVVKDEVLKITSEQERGGEVYTATYNVADLVIPIPNFGPGPMGLDAALQRALGNLGFAGHNPFGGSAAPLAVMASRDGSQNSAAINPNILAQISPPQGGAGSVPLGFGPGGLGGGTDADFDSLIELITSTIQPPTWDEAGGPGSIAAFETNLSLVVSNTQDVHEEIVDLLEQLRRLQDLQVTIEVRFISLNDSFFERIGVDFDFEVVSDIDPNNIPQDTSVTVGLQGPDGAGFTADLDIPFSQGSYGLAVPQFGGFDPGAGAQLGFAILSDIEAFFFINAAQGDRRSNVLQAPKVTLFNGQQATVSDTTQSPFVVGVQPVVGDFAAAQQPVIVVLSEGTFMTVQAVVSNDRRFVRLTLVPFFSKIGEEVKTFTFDGTETSTEDVTAEGWANPNDKKDNRRTNDGNNKTTTRSGTTVQLPTYSYVSVSTTVSVPDGGTVLLGGIKRLSEGRNEFGVPILDKIPYLNRLFKNVGIGRETSSLMMMVTPRIIIQEEEEERLGISATP